jgi:hypothetical protein
MATYEKTPKNQVVRVPQRGHYDRETVYRIIDAALICHVGLVQDDQPYVIPTLHARKDNEILLHGSTKSRLIQYAQAGQNLCVTITLVDGLVLARSVFHHSMNYRSVLLFGQGRLVAEAEKLAYMEHFTNCLIPGRWQDARQPNEQELKATAIVTMPISLASAKIRQGPPGDDEADLQLPVWAGVLPIRQQFLPFEPDQYVTEGVSLPQYLKDFVA